MRILVVDDDDMTREALCSTLSAELDDVELVEAADARTAIRLLATDELALLISDVALEHPASGWALAELARAEGIPVVLVSADVSAAENGSPLPVPLLSKLELDHVDLVGVVECAIASQDERKRPSGAHPAWKD